MCAAGGMGACYGSVKCVGYFSPLVPKPVQLLRRLHLKISVTDWAIRFFTHSIIQIGCMGCKTRLKIM